MRLEEMRSEEMRHLLSSPSDRGADSSLSLTSSVSWRLAHLSTRARRSPQHKTTRRDDMRDDDEARIVTSSLLSRNVSPGLPVGAPGLSIVINYCSLSSRAQSESPLSALWSITLMLRPSRRLGTTRLLLLARSLDLNQQCSVSPCLCPPPLVAPFASEEHSTRNAMRHDAKREMRRVC